MWIKCSERLPDTQREVWVFGPFGYDIDKCLDKVWKHRQDATHWAEQVPPEEE